MNEVVQILNWYKEMGIDEVLSDEAGEFFKNIPADKINLMEVPKATYITQLQNIENSKDQQVIKPSVNYDNQNSNAQVKNNQLNNNLITSARKLAFSANSLEELKENISNFEGCSLKKTAKNLVFSDGNPNSDIMFIGEAPGRDEDLQGKPFVGRSGQLLDKMLKAINLDRTSCYITNIIPYRPPGNRNPSLEEIAIYRGFVDKHIMIFNPKLIVLLGGVSAKELLGTTEGIMRLRGREKSILIEGNNFPSIATYHPAFLLRQPMQKRLAWQDFLLINKKIIAFDNN